MIENLIGKKYGRLKVVSKDNNTRKNRIHLICQCTCGKIVSVSLEHLKNGHTQSCGCLRREKFKRTPTHGLTHTRIYNIWASMKSRCYNKNNKKDYKDYGERGIKMCESWKNSFQDFFSWAMSSGYQDDLTIDRIDVNGDYEPNNCKWSNVIEQANNKRNNHKIFYHGETHTLAEWCRILKLDYNVIIKRIDYHKWDIERAFTQPIRGRC